MDPVILKTFSMNCWAVPFISKDVQVRLTGIGRFLATSDCDIVFLQEVWTKKSFDLIETECRSRFPYARCFYSGRVGTSGLCVLSRFPILDTFFHPFMLNGYWYAIAHGDSHGCKGAGFLRIMVGSVAVNCFISHLHAEYDRKNDTYFAHRIAQAYELLKFTDMTVSAAVNGTLTLIAGDMNLEPKDIGIQVLQTGGFRDTWKELHGEELGATSDTPGNLYTPPSGLHLYPDGKKIDYIFYRAGNGVCELIDSSVHCMKLPDSVLPFSDHEGVTATFKLMPPEKQSPPQTPTPVKATKDNDNDGCDIDVLLQVRQIFANAVKDCNELCLRWIYGILAFMLFGVICAVLAPNMVNCITAPIYALLLVASIMHYLLVMRQEHVHLIEMVHQAEHDLKNKRK